MSAYEKEFNVKKGLSVANTIVVDSGRNVSNVANANVGTLAISGYGQVVAANGKWVGPVDGFGGTGPQGPPGPAGAVIYDGGTPSTDFSVGVGIYLNCGGVT